MHQHPNHKKSKLSHQDIRRIIVLAIWAIILLPIGFYANFILFYYVNINSNFTNQYPASIPDINNQFNCEKSERNWHNNKCWDYKHNPLF